ncbi:DUF2029 domain-containing protein [Corynebacterium rhinophilum]|uniref:DUF2029 domain-containing protein n=1 Tax=Corynebacterium rhinophilum TaxID=3050197 RepID=UPI00254ECDBA|nr:DUF2029 domain-containing protein [Corynebacterium sp. MSK082]MDK8647551.1 DUF2029 domain-containing protein [Corynebacterium sp. MSK082]
MKRFATVPAVWVGWVLARLVLVYFLKLDQSARGDVAYYFAGLFGTDPTKMTEYPHAGTWPTIILSWFTGGDRGVFYIGFTIMTLLVDATFLALLLRHHERNKRVFLAGWFWVFFGTAAGHVFVWRLDIFPAVAVAGAAALLISHPKTGAVLLGFATTMKLWPGVLAAGLVGRFNNSNSWLRLTSFFGSVAALSAFTVFTSGMDRLLSPLNYQGVRGLQLESVPATYLLLQAHLNPGKWRLGYAPSKSFEISGPGVDTAIMWSTIATAGMLVFALSWALYRFFAGGWTSRTTIAFFTLMVLLLIATNKVFSPQYIIWLGPLFAVVIRQQLPAGFVPIKICQGLLAVCAVAAAALGTYIYPFHYDYVWKYVGENLTPVYVLVARNVLILVAVLFALIWFILEVSLSRRIEKAIVAAGGLETSPEAGAENASSPNTGRINVPGSDTPAASEASTDAAKEVTRG